jgi:hypothetical protein
MAGFAFNARLNGGGAYWNGPGYIAGEAPDGLVTVNTAPAQRYVYAVDRASRVVIGATWSAANGTYRIDNLNPAALVDVVARDYTGTYNDAIVSRVSPAPY